jgi:predicted RNA binding protein YcfA (HicA-like mRNA interferase family)
MSNLPLISGKKAIKAFNKDGWIVKRQSGSHIILVKPGSIVTLSIPNHKEVKRGTLRSLIKDAGLSVSEFIDLL